MIKDVAVCNYTQRSFLGCISNIGTINAVRFYNAASQHLEKFSCQHGLKTLAHIQTISWVMLSFWLAFEALDMAGGFTYQDLKLTASIYWWATFSNDWSVSRLSNSISDSSTPDGIRDVGLFERFFEASSTLTVSHAHHGWHNNSEGSPNVSESCAVSVIGYGKGKHNTPRRQGGMMTGEHAQLS